MNGTNPGGAGQAGASPSGIVAPGGLADGGIAAEHARMSTVDLYAATMMHTFGTPQRVLARGEGCYVWDEDGRRYTDLLAGIAVNALGHAHPFVVAAVTAQMQTLGHISNYFASRPQVALAAKLVELLADGRAGYPNARVFFANSGTEANEAAFKATRRTGRTHLVSTTTAFHGRSMGALAVTGKAAYREPFEPLPGDVTFVPYGDADALAGAVTERTAAVVLEPVQGEAGVVIPPAGYLEAARAITRAHGALLWLDEVQTGVGRTGRWFAHHATDVVPDLVTVAKGLGNGFPVGACLGVGDAAELLQPGNHGTTFGGNPVAAVAALATLSVIERDGLLEHVSNTSRWLRERLTALSHPGITDVRAAGLLVGVDLARPVAAAVVAGALDRGYIVNAATASTLRLAPPLIVTRDQLTGFCEQLPSLLDQALGGAA